MRYLLITILLLLPVSVLAVGDDLPPTYDILMLGGEDYQLTMDFAYNGTPVILTGNTFTAQCVDSNNAIFANYSVTAPSNKPGRVAVKLSNRQTPGTVGKIGTWKLVQRTATGVVTYIMYGKCVGRSL